MRFTRSSRRSSYTPIAIKHYGDPDFVQVPMAGLLSNAYTTSRRALIDPARASLEQRPGRPEGTGTEPNHSPIVKNEKAAPEPAREPGDTTSIQVVDAAGNLFSATPSSGWLLGGAFVAGDTGVPMSNRMQAFRLEPGSPNVLAGGKRPRTTLTPTVVLGRSPVSRHRYARWRQPGPADPARAAADLRLRPGRRD